MNTLQAPPVMTPEELPEPAAYMYPGDLAEFAMSVSCTNVDTMERAEPLYTAAQVLALIANAGHVCQCCKARAALSAQDEGAEADAAPSIHQRINMRAKKALLDAALDEIYQQAYEDAKADLLATRTKEA